MKNFIFISPNFPKSYYLFTKALKEVGFNVLAIADCNYEELSQDLRDSICDYYKVPNMNDYNQMYKAVAFFAFKYGPIDFIESNNEYWLETDAKLRSDFNVKTGKNADSIIMFKSKEEEKKYYKLANVPTARYHIPTTLELGKKFIEEVGYPVVVKPDNGVGASKTYKITNHAELEAFYKELPATKYIMEEYVDGDLISFDGVSNGNAEPVFCSNEVFPTTIMDIVNEGQESFYYCNLGCPEDLKDVGARTLKAFGAKYRYFHMEYFRLRSDKKGLGKKGDIIGLEVNMRAPGGYTPDMINFAHGANTYKIWAEVMMYNEVKTEFKNPEYYCVYAGRRKTIKYKNDYAYMSKKYKLVMHDIMPEVLAGAMGDEFYVANVSTKEEIDAFLKDAYLK